MPEFVINTAITVSAPSLEDAMVGAQLAMSHIPLGFNEKEPAVVPKNQVVFVENWWIAEDKRQDGSDNDSAVFVHVGKQVEALHSLRVLGLTGKHNTFGHSAGLEVAYAMSQVLSISNLLATSRTLDTRELPEIQGKLGQAMSVLNAMRVDG